MSNLKEFVKCIALDAVTGNLWRLWWGVVVVVIDGSRSSIWRNIFGRYNCRNWIFVIRITTFGCHMCPAKERKSTIRDERSECYWVWQIQNRKVSFETFILFKRQKEFDAFQKAKSSLFNYDLTEKISSECSFDNFFLAGSFNLNRIVMWSEFIMSMPSNQNKFNEYSSIEYFYYFSFFCSCLSMSFCSAQLFLRKLYTQFVEV